MKFAKRVAELKSSTILEIAAKAQELKMKGFDIVSLAAGEPDTNTPEPIQEACTKAMRDGITKYTPSQGFLALREAIAEFNFKYNEWEAKPEEIVVTAGGKQAIYNALQCLVEEGDYVLVPTPAWISYAPMIELSGAKLFPLPLYEEDGYQINVDRWKNMSIPPTAKGILINSPCNPTGVVYKPQELKKLAAWALQRNLWVISDEIYDRITFDGIKHVSMASLGPEVKANTITISGFSKTFSMTGWRLGWAVGQKDLISRISALQSQSTSHVTSFVQMAGITAAKLPTSFFLELVQKFESRRNYCIERLDQLHNYLSYVKPEGAFYFYINASRWMEKTGKTEADLVKDLLEKHGVGIVPGSPFGKEKTFRISYATSPDNLKKAFDRMELYLKG